MILLSRIIKSSQAKEQLDQYEIKIRDLHYLAQNTGETEKQEDLASALRANELISQAKEEAQSIILAAEQHAAEITSIIEQQKNTWEQEEKPLVIEQAQKEGYQQGIEDGQQKGYSEMAASIAYARDVIELAKEDYAKHIEAAEPVILEIAMNVAGKILAYEINHNEEAFFSMVKQAMKEARESKEVQLHVHPSQYPFLLSQKLELEAIFPKYAELYLFPDEELAEGSCIIESETGRIDASIDSQLTEIKNKLMELLLEGES